MQRFSKEIQTAANRPSEHALQFGEFRMEASERLLSRGGLPVPLSPRTFDVLLLLVRNAGRILTKRAILDSVWLDANVEETNLTNAISQLRKALGDPTLIETLSKQGYRFEAADAKG